MTKTPFRMIGCALTLAALLTTGCKVQIGTTPGTGNPPVTVQQATGSVKVAFQGLPAAYQTLATRYDIDHVQLSLTPSRGKAQTRTVYLHKMQPGLNEYQFTKVATGPVQLQVTAFDAGNGAIGKGFNSAQVASNSTAFMHVAVKLDPNAGTGDVAALITFEDGLGSSDEDLFYQGDRDGDGFLNLGEYRDVYYRRDVVEAVPVATATPFCRIPPMPVTTPVPTPTNVGVATSIARCPVIDPVHASFQNKDWNQDGQLSLDEFLGRVYAGIPAAASVED